MSNAGPSVSVQPGEDTPLLQADASPTSPTAPHNDRDDQIEEESQFVLTDRQAAIARVDKALKILFALTITTGTVAAALNITHIILSKYGHENFGYFDFAVLFYEWQIFWQTIIAIALSIFNLIHLSQRSQPLPALLNILVFGIDGIFTFFSSIDAIARSDALFGSLCRVDLDDPPDWGHRYPGSYGQCLSWEPKFRVVSWLWLCLQVVVGLVMAAVAVTSLVRVYKLRSRRETGRDGGREGSRWTIPAGQVSFEVSVHWGAPAPEGAGRPRRGESEAVEEGR